jgi:hypothetical protein
MQDYLAVMFWWSSSQNYLWYPIELTSQSNNDTMWSRLIDIMVFPHIWLVENNITDIKRGNITHYFMLEGMDSIGHATLLADAKISSLVKPPNVLWI